MAMIRITISDQPDVRLVIMPNQSGRVIQLQSMEGLDPSKQLSKLINKFKKSSQNQKIILFNTQND